VAGALEIGDAPIAQPAPAVSAHRWMVALSIMLGTFLEVLDRGQRADWFASTWVVLATATAVVCFVCLIWRELTFAHPILDLRIFLKPTSTLAVCLVVLMTGITWAVNLLNPIFMQEFLGYSAWRAGLTLAPRAIGAMMAMVLVGQMVRLGFNTRPLMFLGLLLQCLGLWNMATWSLQVNAGEVTKSTILLSTGFAMIFPTLSASTLQCVERERMGYAASLFSMIRNMGSSIGIAVMSALMVSYQQIHQSYLGEHFSVFQAWQLGAAPQRMPGSPHFSSLPEQLAAGRHEGLKMIYDMVQLHAAMLALNDVYRILLAIAATLNPTLVVIWLWQDSKAIRPQAMREPAAVH
jgi:MFS transporter, DHA2 family, multidrug resistance protein